MTKLTITGSILITALLAVAPLLAEGTVKAKAQPSLKELRALFGVAVSSPEVSTFVKRYSLKKTAKGEEGSFSPEDQAYSVMFTKHTVSTIVLTSNQGPWQPSDWNAYTNLPFRLAFADSHKVVAKKLKLKTSHFSLPIERLAHSVTFEDLSMRLYFHKSDTLRDIHIIASKKDSQQIAAPLPSEGAPSNGR
jgi:hypothetical protein